MVLCGLGLLVAAVRLLPLQSWLQAVLDWMAGLGPWGPVLFAAFYVVAALLFVPGSLLTASGGLLFGVLKGTCVVSIATWIAACIAFSISRYLARAWVVKKLEQHPRYRAVDEAVAAEGWKIVGLMRLSPVFPFNVLNCLFGVTKVSFKHYALATWVGMIPTLVLYTYIGSVAGSLANLGTSSRQRTPLEWAFYGLGFLAVVILTCFLIRLSRRALAGKMDR